MKRIIDDRSIRSMLRSDKATHNRITDEDILLIMQDERRNGDYVVTKSTKRLGKIRRFIED